MVATPPPERLTLPVATVTGAVAGLFAAIAVALAPIALLESVVLASGLPAVLPAAMPPLGASARAAMVLLVGGGIAGLGWAVPYLILGDRKVTLGKSNRQRTASLRMDGPVQSVRRADSHPDAAPRPPVRAARDLGMPLPPLAEQQLPRDLDQPLAAFDEGAIPLVAAPPAPMVAPLFRPAAQDRIETFELVPPAPAPGPVVTPERTPARRSSTEVTVQALLARLERGVEQRDVSAPTTAPDSPVASPPPSEGLEATLRQLRRMAAGA